MFFKSLFSKKKEQPEKIKLSLEEVGDWIKKENKSFFEELSREISEYYRAVEDEFKDLTESFKIFKEAKVPSETFERLRKAAETNKKIIEKDIEKFIDSFSIPDKTDFNTAFNFSGLTSRKIVELGKKNNRGFNILTDAMMEETKNFKKSIGGLEREVFEMNKFLMGKSQRVKDIENVGKMSKEILSLIRESKEKEKKIKKMKDAISSQLKKKKDMESEIEKLKSSKELSELKKNKEALDNLKSREEELKNEVIHEVSKLEKAFKKISYQSGKSTMNRYIENPLDFIKDKNGLNDFKNILSDVKNIIHGGNCKLSEKVKKKTLEEIERINSGVLDRILNEYNEVSSQISQLSEKVSKSEILKRIESKKEELEKLEEKILTAEKSLDMLKEDVTEEIESKKHELIRKIKDLSGKDIVF